jgi:hypothetical protein
MSASFRKSELPVANFDIPALQERLKYLQELKKVYRKDITIYRKLIFSTAP